MQQQSHKIEHKPSLSAPNSYLKSKALRYERFDSVRVETVGKKKLAVETDKRFMHSIEQITKFQSSVFDEILGVKDSLLNQVECEQIHFKAKRHSQANILNVNSDMNKNDVIRQPSLKSLYCKCGCQRLRGGKYPMCCDLQKISILGSGILLFFFFLKALVISIVLFLLIYGIFVITINLLGEQKLAVSEQCSSSYCLFRDNTSDLHNKNQQYRMIAQWLGLAAMVVWVIWSRIIKYIGNLKNEEIDKNLKSASDYAIKISNLPYGQYNEEELVEYFQKLTQSELLQKQNENQKQIHHQLSDMQLKAKDKRPQESNEVVGAGLGELLKGKLVGKIFAENETGIRSIQIIYNMEFSRRLIEKIFKFAKQIKSQVTLKNDKYIIQDKNEYHSIKNELIETYEVFEDLRKKFLNDSKFRKALSSRVSIIEFKQEKDKTIFLKKYGKESLTMFKQLKQKILDKCFGNSNSIVFKGSIPQIIRAPQPSDIQWQNCQKKQSLLRMLLIYIITLFLILLSLGIMVGLEYAQSYFKNSNSSQDDSSSTLLNIVVSVVMQVINTALWISLSILLDLEYNHTLTNKIVSQMNKTSVAMWINIIVLPILVNYIINNRYYGADGLAGIAFDYHISSIVVGLTIKLFDPVNLIFKLIISIKCFRHYFIKARYRKKNKEDQIQEEAMKNVYQFYQAPEFNIAQAYTYILSNVLHAAFFCPLQPFLLLLVLFEGIFFYWVCKFKIVKFCKIPQITEKLIFDVASYQLILVPVFYGAGSIFNSYIGNKLDDTREFRYLGSAICVGIGLLNYFNPKNLVQEFINIFVIKCTCCFPQGDKAKELHSALEQRVNESKQGVRLETYYKSSNALSLLGFENILLGKTNTSQIETQLKNYCESHVNNGNKSQRVEEKEPSQGIPLDKDTELDDHLNWTNTPF